jgi:cysteine desulfurase/selenocysteine lyase
MWINIMSTNKFDQENGIAQFPDPVTGCLPNVELLTRITDDLFRAYTPTTTPSPTAASLPQSSVELPPDNHVSTTAYTGGHIPEPSYPLPIPMPYEAELKALFSSYEDKIPAHVGMPGGDGLAQQQHAESSYYFLDTTVVVPVRDEQVAQIASTHPPFDVNAIRRDFPILRESVNGHALVWLDNAATTQKPQAVIDRLSYFYEHENSNIHRAAHKLAARATDAYEEARKTVARFINAPSTDGVIFVRGTTEGINLIAQSWGRQYIGEGDEIVITWLEHHANIVPWQILCNERGAKLRVAPVDEDGQILLEEYQKLLNSNTKLVAFSQVSNALGTVTPAKQMVEMAHRVGARVLVDGAQSVSHMRVDVQQLGCDWFVFSGHKVFGPTGIGAVFGKMELLETTQPWQGGGNMIQDVTFEKTTYHSAPDRFEAGTGNIADAVGLGAAINYVEHVGIENIHRYEHDLLIYATHCLKSISGLRLIGTAPEKAGVLSFTLKGFTSEEVGAALNQEGIAVRAGHHCAQPILRRFGLETTVRPSLAFYNTYGDIDKLETAIRHIQESRPLF